MKEQRRWVVVLLASLILVLFVFGVQSALAATPIESGETLCGNLGVSEFHTYEFYGEAGDRILVDASKTGGDYYFDTEIRLIDPEFQDEADTYPGGDLLDHFLEKTGTYTIIVQDVGLNHPGSYCFTLIDLSMGPLTSSDDPNGGPTISGDTLCGNNIHSDMDAFQFYGEAGDRILVDASKTGGDYYYNTEIRLIDPDFEDEANTQSGGDLLDHFLLKTGIYTIIVQDAGLNHPGSYCITLLNLNGPFSSQHDCDGGLIGIGSSMDGNNANSDMDVFVFYGAAGDRVFIDADKTGGNYYYNTEIRLFDPDNVDEIDTIPGGDLLDHFLLKSGMYKIVIQDSGLNHAGTYAITFNKLPDTDRPGIYFPSPATGCDQPEDLTLTWDPVAGATGYDVLFGNDTLAPLELLCTNINTPSCAATDLQKGEVYYWMVVAHTPGGEIQGTVNWFVTELPCDLNHDCSCNILDYQTFIQDWGSTTCGDPPGSGNPPNDCECDLDTNGKCNILDYQVFIQDWGRTICP